MTETRGLKVNDVLRHALTNELYVVTSVSEDTVAIKGIYNDEAFEVSREMAEAEPFQEIYIFCWNAVEEGWAGA